MDEMAGRRELLSCWAGPSGGCRAARCARGRPFHADSPPVCSGACTRYMVSVGGAFPQRLTLLAWCPGRHPLQRRYVLYHPNRLLAARPSSVCCPGASQRGKPAGHLVLDMRGQIALAACCIIMSRKHKTGGTEECAHTVHMQRTRSVHRPSQAGLETTGQTGSAGQWARVSGVCWKRPETLQQMPRRSDKEKNLPKLDHELAPVPCQGQVPPPFALFCPKETEEPHAMATLGDYDSIQTNLTESSGTAPAERARRQS